MYHRDTKRWKIRVIRWLEEQSEKFLKRLIGVQDKNNIENEGK